MFGWEKKIDPEVTNKVLNDPNSLTSTLLINPEVFNEFSPTIPNKFPKELIPKEICENQMKSLLTCLIDNKFDNVNCEQFQFKYFECKKWRDSLIFKRINEWEINEYDVMDEKQKVEHLDILKIKKLEFINLYDETEVIPKNRHRRIRISSDIEQLAWRINYLEKFLNNKLSV
jgi:hypothetical protein